MIGRRLCRASSVQRPESSAKNANALDPRRSSLDSTPSSSSRPLDPGLSTPSSEALDSRPSSLVSPKAQAPSDWVYALKDVSFEVKRGEVLGIIGRNGAGKSTLLKILSRVTTQSSGQIKVRDRIASLLEVGTGFHPELTGREPEGWEACRTSNRRLAQRVQRRRRGANQNIFLNGAILGMRTAEIARKFDEIVEFSGCARYIDTPPPANASPPTPHAPARLLDCHGLRCIGRLPRPRALPPRHAPPHRPHGRVGVAGKIKMIPI